MLKSILKYAPLDLLLEILIGKLADTVKNPNSVKAQAIKEQVERIYKLTGEFLSKVW